MPGSKPPSAFLCTQAREHSTSLFALPHPLAFFPSGIIVASYALLSQEQCCSWDLSTLSSSQIFVWFSPSPSSVTFWGFRTWAHSVCLLSLLPLTPGPPNLSDTWKVFNDSFSPFQPLPYPCIHSFQIHDLFFFSYYIHVCTCTCVHVYPHMWINIWMNAAEYV